MNPKYHIIKRQCFEIDLPPETLNGHEVQSEIAALFRNRLLPAMEEVFDRLSPDDRVIRIDRLEIDIGELNYNQMLTHLTEKVPDQLYDKITELLIEHNSRQHLRQFENLPGTKGDGKVQVLLREDSQIDALAHFLQTGHMPWDTGTKAGKVPFLQLFLELAASNMEETARMLQNELKRSPGRRRFIFQVPDEILFRIFPVFAANGLENSSQYRVIKKLAGFSWSMSEALRKTGRFKALSWNEFRLRFWGRLVEIVFINQERVPASKTWLRGQIMDLLREVAGETISGEDTGEKSNRLGKAVRRILQLLEGERENLNVKLVDVLAAFLEKDLSSLYIKQDNVPSRLNPGKTGHDQKKDEPGASPGEQTAKPTREGQFAKASRVAGPGKSSTGGRSNADYPGNVTVNGIHGGENINKVRGRDWAHESINPPLSVPENGDAKLQGISGPVQNAREAWIGNAGIVILHPFLKSFFEKLDLVREKEFVSQEARHRAVHLIQYLVTGQNETDEEELFLNKLMCGLVPEFPVIRSIDLYDGEMEECERLLEYVIEQWSVLKKASPESIRSTFLNREGLITMEGPGGGWKLIVERKTLDVLLDRLPWGISIIKLPWNPYFIYVEW